MEDAGSKEIEEVKKDESMVIETLESEDIDHNKLPESLEKNKSKLDDKITSLDLRPK